jgi:hypothetical protein
LPEAKSPIKITLERKTYKSNIQGVIDGLDDRDWDWGSGIGYQVSGIRNQGSGYRLQVVGLPRPRIGSWNRLLVAEIGNQKSEIGNHPIASLSENKAYRDP